MASYVDHIADGQDGAEVLALVNEFVGKLWQTGAIRQMPRLLRLRRIHASSDIGFWLWLTAASIRGTVIQRAPAPSAVFALHAVLETAFHRLRALDALAAGITCGK